ncbi:MAG TPA: hypothetical protein PK190_13000 [Bacteroidia bacterium]|nr:hypothetical protein [Bacteroidia bacterium]
MPRVLQLDNKTNITIDTEPCGSGGSGEVYKILSPTSLTNQVVKLYHKERLTKEAEEKIKYLVVKKINQGDHESIVWIKNTVVDNGRFVGFTMNYADGIGLEQFLNDRWWRKNETKDWDKFKLENENGIVYRIKLCLNISIAVNIIHKNSNYTIADIKPSNFKVHKNGLVSIIDIDNIEVVENGKVLYAAQVITPDFSPPEFHKGLNYKQSAASQNWDRYSLAILFYNILCGIHPFVGVGCNPPFEDCTDSPDMIKNGLFLHGAKSSYVNFKSPQHSNFSKLNQELQSIFIQCFDGGHDKPHLRPSAEDWCRVLSYNKLIAKRPSVTELLNSDTTYSNKFKNALQFNVYSSALTLKSIEVTYPDVKFQNLSNTLNMFDKVLNLFTKSPKRMLIDELKTIEKDIKAVINKQPSIKSEISDIISEFEKKQQEIKAEEKNQIEKLKKSLQLSLNDAEYLANGIQSEEAKELSQLQNQINSLIHKEDVSLANFHSLTYGDLINNFDKKRIEHQSNINSCDVQKKNEMERLINSPTKLSHYNIEKECIKIFHGNLPSVISTLKQLNFFTAADFNKVYSNGYLRNTSNKDVRIPGMGTERSNKLHVWRVKIEADENDKIIREVNAKYDKLLSEISLKWRGIENNHTQTLSPLNSRFRNKEAEIKRNKDRLIDTKETEVKKINMKFDKLHTDIKNEFIKSLNKFYTDLDNIYLQTKNALLKNLSFYEDKLKSKLLEVQDTIHWIDNRKVKYNSLYVRLNNSSI